MNAEQADVAPAGSADRGEGTPADLGDLLSRVAYGDEDAFAALYSQTAGPVYGLACLLTGDADWSQEVTAQALTEVWRAAPRYDPARDSPQAWVMSIARRYVVRRVRATRGDGAIRAALLQV